MSMNKKRNLVGRIMQVAVLLIMSLGAAAYPALANGSSGAVYVLTNQSPNNSVMVFFRAPDGTLTLSGSFSTGGTGAGSGADPLGSQGALMLDPGGRLLFAVNSGSNQVSVFAVEGHRLHLIDKVPSGGQMPVSITIFGRLVYVLNAGGTPNIQGFLISPFGNHLVSLPGSARSLAGGSSASPAQIAFRLDGSVLMVTEKGTQTIDTYTIDNLGYASGPISHPSNGATPFGFAFIHRGFVVVSEAGPNALSSYQVGEDGDLDLISGSVPNNQMATCWAVVPNDGRYAYTANAGSATISSYTIAPDGMLSLLKASAGSTASGSAPTDTAVSAGGRFLYVRTGGNGSVTGFRVEADGSLTPLGSVGGVPAGAQGIAAR